MKTKTLFQERSFKTPFLYRVLEGMTTLCMPLGFIVGGGSINSILFLFYIIHSMASLSFHLFPSELTYWLDISMINLLVMERGYNLCCSVWVYPLCLITMFYESPKSHVGCVIRTVMIVILSQTSSIYYWCMWIICLFTFLQSSNYMIKGDAFKTMLTCCLYHIYLGCICSIEISYYKSFSGNSCLLEQFLRYCFYFVFIFYTFIHITTNPKYLNCIFSLTTSLVLSPLGFYEIRCQFLTPDILYKDSIQKDILLFYIAHCIMDMTIGYVFYPSYFKFLEGWCHHIMTSIFAIIFLWRDTMIFFCFALVWETSTIFLNLSRLFPNVKIFKHIFMYCFLFVRIILPTFFIIYFYPLSKDLGCLVSYILSTIVNSYWLNKQFSKMKIKR